VDAAREAGGRHCAACHIVCFGWAVVRGGRVAVATVLDADVQRSSRSVRSGGGCGCIGSRFARLVAPETILERATPRRYLRYFQHIDLNRLPLVVIVPAPGAPARFHLAAATAVFAAMRSGRFCGTEPWRDDRRAAFMRLGPDPAFCGFRSCRARPTKRLHVFARPSVYIARQRSSIGPRVGEAGTS